MQHGIARLNALGVLESTVAMDTRFRAAIARCLSNLSVGTIQKIELMEGSKALLVEKKGKNWVISVSNGDTQACLFQVNKNAVNEEKRAEKPFLSLMSNDAELKPAA